MLFTNSSMSYVLDLFKFNYLRLIGVVYEEYGYCLFPTFSMLL